MAAYDFYPGSNISSITFTVMPQQLFLFDAIKDSESDKDLLLTGEDTEKPDENAIPDVEETTIIIEKETGTVTNPFANVQQQQQDKVDLMLLTPNKKRGRKSFKEMDEESILIDVPDDEVLYQKQYYSTRIVAEWFGITQSQLRLWETEFDILKPKKNAKGDRFFRPEDVKNLTLIYHLLRRRKFTVQGARQYLTEHKKKLQATIQLVESLNKLKQFLLELKAISG